MPATKPEARPMPTTRDGMAKLLRERIEESGLSSSQFAETVLIRDSRTIRRWISGESPVPQQVADFLVKPWRSPYPSR